MTDLESRVFEALREAWKPYRTTGEWHDQAGIGDMAKAVMAVLPKALTAELLLEAAAFIYDEWSGTDPDNDAHAVVVSLRTCAYALDRSQLPGAVGESVPMSPPSTRAE